MSANTNPIFTLVPIIGAAQISIANTLRNGTGTMGTLATGATDGTRIHEIFVKATGTTTAGMIRIFIDSGSAVRLWKEYLVSAITPSGTVAAFENDDFRADNLPLLILPFGWLLKASTHIGEEFNVFAMGGNYS